MKKITLRLIVLICSITSAYASQPGYDWHNKNAPPLTLEAFRNYLNPGRTIPDKCTKYFLWNKDQYYIVLSGILNEYSQKAGVSKSWTNVDIYTELCKPSTVTVDPVAFTSAGWQTCGSARSPQVSITWYKRDARPGEMFVGLMSEEFNKTLLPILSLNCGNGVKLVNFYITKPEPTNVGPVIYKEPEEPVEYEKDVVIEDITYQEIEPEVEQHITVIKAPQQQPIIIQEQAQQQVVCQQQQPQQMYQQRYMPIQQNGGWSGGFSGGGYSQPASNYNQQSWSTTQNASSTNVNDNSNTFNNNPQVSYTQRPRPNTGNPNSYNSGSPAPSSGNSNGGPVWNPGNGNFGGPVGNSGVGGGGPVGNPGNGNGRMSSGGNGLAFRSFGSRR